jgi:hypothetical protein
MTPEEITTMLRIRTLIYWLIYGSSFFLASCNGAVEPPVTDCTTPITILPTATRQTDPDLSAPPAALPPGGDGTSYCPTPVAPATATAPTPEQFVTTRVVNLSLDEADQALASTAVGDDMVAVGWIRDGQVAVALSRGGNHFQVRTLGAGESVSLAFSRANRLHVALEQDGQITYRAADQGTHPADVTPIFVADGRSPQVVVDEANWAHLLYEANGRIYQAKHLSGEAWLTRYVTDGTLLAVRPFYNEGGGNPFGLPGDAYWFGLLAAVQNNGQLRLLRYLSWFNLWQETAVFPIAPDAPLTGRVGLDYEAISDDEAWTVAAWVTHRAAAQEAGPVYRQPRFDWANPLFPEQIANPSQIHAGLNAVRWSSDAPFDAGLRQTVVVDNPGGMLSATAWGQGETGTGEPVRLRIGIDPTGGENPDGATVVWSAEATPMGAFTQLRVDAPAQGETATLFLRGTFDTASARPAATTGLVVWDTAVMQDGAGVNLDFEGSWGMQDSITVPVGWSAWYQDDGSSTPPHRDVYTVVAAWSEDGGATWSGPTAITANRERSGGTTGAIEPDVTPVIARATEPPSVAFFYIYASGDPPPESGLRRFGRPYQSQCAWGMTDCTEMPGTPLLPRPVVRPSTRLLAAADPFDAGRVLLVWDGLQTDEQRRDVYATYAALR